jgi:hypothetical protein
VVTSENALIVRRLVNSRRIVLIWRPMRNSYMLQMPQRGDYNCATTLLVSIWKPKEGWIVDSIFSFHMCTRNEYFENIVLVDGRVVHLGGTKTSKVQGMRTVHLKMIGGYEFLLHDVKYIPKFMHFFNL